MSSNTKSEKIFEKFCEDNNIPCKKVKQSDKKTPDYKVQFKNQFNKNYFVYVEVKEINKDTNFNIDNQGLHSRKVGEHIRKKIKDAREQLKAVSEEGYPSILLIYNNLDGLQLFGTERHDFISAMYGDLTVNINIDGNKIMGPYYGYNRSFDQNKSTYISAVGFLYMDRDIPKPGITIYENIYAKNSLDFDCIPECIEVVRFKLESPPKVTPK